MTWPGAARRTLGSRDSERGSLSLKRTWSLGQEARAKSEARRERERERERGEKEARKRQGRGKEEARGRRLEGEELPVPSHPT